MLHLVMYPLDRRNLVNHVYSLFLSLRKTAIVLQVSHTTVSRWLKNSLRKHYARKAFKEEQITGSLISAVRNDPFVTLLKLRELMCTLFSITVSKELLRTVIKKNGITKKKAKHFAEPVHLKQATEEFLIKRAAFVVEARPFVSLDETSFGRNGIEVRGYAPIGKKLVIRRQNTRMTTVSVLAIISPDEIVHLEHAQGAYNTAMLLAYLKNLVLQPGTVILLDNCRFHHANDIKKYATQQGWELLYTPPYSPWFNPIEGVFSIVKRAYYQNHTIQESFERVTSSHTRAFFQKSMSLTSMPA